MTQNPTDTAHFRVADLPAGRPVAFRLEPEGEQLKAIADELGLLGLRKLRFAGRLVPDGRTDWRLEADLGATVVQACVVTLEPVTTRIDQPVIRRFLREMPQGMPDGDEIEMPEDDTSEPLGDVIDLNTVMREALALALPDYPRADTAELEQTGFAPPGVDPMSDEDTKPFAGLAALKRQLEDKD